MTEPSARPPGPAHPFDLTGRVAVVTGGNNGIGLGLARGLVRAGAHVHVWGTSAERNERAVAELAPLGAVESAVVDVADEARVVAAMDDVASRHGRLDACFANAGIALPRIPLHDTTLEQLRRVQAINVDGVFLTLREAARHMVAAGHGGSLVATSSLAVLMGQSGGYPYAASKGALGPMVQALAVELARHGIRANTLLPGWTESAMLDVPLQDDRFVDAVLPRIPVRRWGTGADFEGIAVYLAGDASAYHTGDAIRIDGGYAVY
ncbi:MAG: SDR family oxidoreductase [Solirubrobacteraceae bacterium]|nr:SDR family oxidoreductase [Solirubrobacteraceae bacterium]